LTINRLHCRDTIHCSSNGIHAVGIVKQAKGASGARSSAPYVDSLHRKTITRTFKDSLFRSGPLSPCHRCQASSIVTSTRACGCFDSNRNVIGIVPNNTIFVWSKPNTLADKTHHSGPFAVMRAITWTSRTHSDPQKETMSCLHRLVSSVAQTTSPRNERIILILSLQSKEVSSNDCNALGFDRHKDSYEIGIAN
jgi:hypothetical protein